ncbi:MAG: hypothetical protein KJ970_00050 [Candidatus Eisenbacteria bacterium]|uniref:SRPBCC domain-containing protein n=1 Tax=Eiseniibacteriota bacterium TaxID=2212470 RepID=A0A948RUQ3_UNCEI|nr:hypothetical protein [Candidatus Eisenbacteria bacterium]MBU1948792.1 hypothetical protein [Candidatus Eisenbacteria bacterium]MBU2689292.1 hypothetical protein [Candidatus Eisenbacteria bacterium]
MKQLFSQFVILVVLSVCAPAVAEVSSCTDSGFFLKIEIPIYGTPLSVYNNLVQDVSEWWDPAHTFSGDSKNLSIDARPGGCFCEALPDGGGVRHLEVVYNSPGKTLRMSGALGPLQGFGLAGSMTWMFEAIGDSTRLGFTYSVGGYIDGGLQNIAPIVDTVLNGQLIRLKRFAETGNPNQ